MKRACSSNRQGAVVVEAAFVLPIALVMMLGMWEVGRMVQVDQVLVNSAREGARLAAGGYVNGTAVTVAMVQQAVRDYLTAAGFPSTAVSSAVITITPQSPASWTDPSSALPLDVFQVSVNIPAGTAFNSLRWNALPQITPVTQLTASVKWMSLNNSAVVVSTALPY